MARRWVCPNCGGAVNGPERPRKNDVRRYCLKCSADTGLLVEREAPALERKRANRKAVTAAKDQTKRERERAKRIITTYDAGGFEHQIDVHLELRRALRDCGFFEGWYAGNAPKMSELKITIRRRDDPRTSGRVWGNFEVLFTFGTSYEEALEVIYHEAAHMAAPHDEHHGPRFRRILADALQKRWPWLRYGSINRGRCYGADAEIVEQMRNHVKTEGEL